MAWEPDIQRSRAASASGTQRFSIPRVYVMIGLTLMAWVLAAAAIAALWSLVRFITA